MLLKVLMVLTVPNLLRSDHLQRGAAPFNLLHGNKADVWQNIGEDYSRQRKVQTQFNKSIFNQGHSLLREKNKYCMSSLLLLWSRPLCSGSLSPNLQKMTKGTTYLIIPPLNYRCGWESLDSGFPPVSSTLPRSLFISCFPPGEMVRSVWEDPSTRIYRLIYGSALTLTR